MNDLLPWRESSLMHQAGFTLLELLVVLVLIGLMASFTGPQLWRTYDKAQEKSVVQVFAQALQDMRVHAIHSGKSIKLNAVSKGGSEAVDSLPELPHGWVIEQSTSLRILPTGVTNGGSFYLLSPEARRWLLTLQPFDGHWDIKAL